MGISTRTYYLPPPGTPPFEWFMTNPRCFLPPDQHWKKVPEEYAIGVKWKKTPNGHVPSMVSDGKGNVTQETKKGKRKKWVPDKERNEALARGEEIPPRNYLDLTTEERVYLGRSEFREFTQYLKHEDEIIASRRNDYNDLLKAGEAEKKKLGDAISTANQRLREKLAALEAEERRADQALADKAKSGSGGQRGK